MTLHSTYRGEPVWRVGLSWYTRSFGGDSFLRDPNTGEHIRHHRTRADARAYIAARQFADHRPDCGISRGDGCECDATVWDEHGD